MIASLAFNRISAAFLCIVVGPVAARCGDRAINDAPFSKKPHSVKSFRDCPDCPEMVKLPSGTFFDGRDRFRSEGIYR
jgi:hypothetical protein